MRCAWKENNSTFFSLSSTHSIVTSKLLLGQVGMEGEMEIKLVTKTKLKSTCMKIDTVDEV